MCDDDHDYDEVGCRLEEVFKFKVLCFHSIHEKHLQEVWWVVLLTIGWKCSIRGLAHIHILVDRLHSHIPHLLRSSLSPANSFHQKRNHSSVSFYKVYRSSKPHGRPYSFQSFPTFLLPLFSAITSTILAANMIFVPHTWKPQTVSQRCCCCRQKKLACIPLHVTSMVHLRICMYTDFFYTCQNVPLARRWQSP